MVLAGRHQLGFGGLGFASSLASGLLNPRVLPVRRHLEEPPVSHTVKAERQLKQPRGLLSDGDDELPFFKKKKKKLGFLKDLGAASRGWDNRGIPAFGIKQLAPAPKAGKQSAKPIIAR